MLDHDAIRALVASVAERSMTAGDNKTLLRAAMAAVRDCAGTMDTQATSLLQSLLTVAIDKGLRTTALNSRDGLKDASGRVMFELALLQVEVGEGKVQVAKVVERLTGMDALMMRALGAMTDVVDQLEQAAERDEANEPAFVLVIEAIGVLLQALEKAKGATKTLEGAVGVQPPAVPRRSD